MIDDNNPGGEWHAGLNCHPARLKYCFRTKCGTLSMNEGDMAKVKGLIYVFKTIDRDVRRIETYKGRKLGIVLVRHGDEWERLTSAQAIQGTVAA